MIYDENPQLDGGRFTPGTRDPVTVSDDDPVKSVDYKTGDGTVWTVRSRE